MLTRVAAGRAPVAREVRAAGPLMSALAAPLTARGLWLTTALNVRPTGLTGRVRPRAVVVARHPGPPDGLALLTLRRRGPTTAVRLLGDPAGPVPGGAPANRLYARDDEVARRLADGVLDLLGGLRGPWTLRLTGLPLGDPTLAWLAPGLAAARATAQFANSRSRRLVDELDGLPGLVRTRDPGAIEQWLPALLPRLPVAERPFLRAAARLHAAVGTLELAVVPGGGRRDVAPVAALLTLLDDRGRPGPLERWPWWGWSDVGGLRRELGSPVVTLTAATGLRLSGRR